MPRPQALAGLHQGESAFGTDLRGIQPKLVAGRAFPYSLAFNHSKALSFGALYRTFISSESGILRFRPFGGIGFMNHLR